MCLLYLISIIGFFIGSLKFSKESNLKGIINGLVYFTPMFLLMLILSLTIFKTKVNLNSTIYYFILLIFSTLGAIIGKNMKEESVS